MQRPNDQGIYELNIKTAGTHSVVFQYLGYKTQKHRSDKNSFTLDVKMQERRFFL
jgi:hypothetical protein